MHELDDMDHMNSDVDLDHDTAPLMPRARVPTNGPNRIEAALATPHRRLRAVARDTSESV